MDRTSELLEIVGGDSPADLRTRKDPSAFIVRATQTHDTICNFEVLIERLREPFVDFHRYLPRSELRNMPAMTESDRVTLSQEIVGFISSVSSQIQGLTRELEDLIAEEESITPKTQHYRLVLSSLLSKLSSFSAQSDRMQREHRARTVNPRRLLSDRYFGCVRDTREGGDEDIVDEATKSRTGASIMSFMGAALDTNRDKAAASALDQSASAATLPAPSAATTTTENTFAQRYIDEVASRSKLREYDAIAAKQRDALIREAKVLKVKFSEEIEESQKMERTVTNISSLISEFVQLIESQSALVDTIGEVSQDTTASVKSADQELLLTLERSQSHQWSMIMFVAGMAFLLLLLDFLSP